MSDREQMRQISLKVRPDYMQWIAYSEPESVDELKKCRMKVEAGLSAMENKVATPKNSEEKRTALGRGQAVVSVVLLPTESQIRNVLNPLNLKLVINVDANITSQRIVLLQARQTEPRLPDKHRLGSP